MYPQPQLLHPLVLLMRLLMPCLSRKIEYLQLLSVSATEIDIVSAHAPQVVIELHQRCARLNLPLWYDLQLLGAFRFLPHLDFIQPRRVAACHQITQYAVQGNSRSVKGAVWKERPDLAVVKIRGI